MRYFLLIFLFTSLHLRAENIVECLAEKIVDLKVGDTDGEIDVEPNSGFFKGGILFNSNFGNKSWDGGHFDFCNKLTYDQKQELGIIRSFLACKSRIPSESECSSWETFYKNSLGHHLEEGGQEETFLTKSRWEQLRHLYLETDLPSRLTVLSTSAQESDDDGNKAESRLELLELAKNSNPVIEGVHNQKNKVNGDSIFQVLQAFFLDAIIGFWNLLKILSSLFLQLWSFLCAGL